MALKDHLAVVPDFKEGFVQLDRHTVVLRRFEIRTEIDGCQVRLDVQIQNGGSPRCLSVTVHGPALKESDGADLASLPDAGVTNRVLRKIKVAELIGRARKVPLMTMKPLESPKCTLKFGPLSADEELELFDRYGVADYKPTRGKPLTDKHLKAVAETYRGAVERGDRPAKHICEVAGVSRPVAANWIRAARDRGFLGDAIPGKAGEVSFDAER